MIRTVTFDYWNTLVVAYDGALFQRRRKHVTEIQAGGAVRRAR